MDVTAVPSEEVLGISGPDNGATGICPFRREQKMIKSQEFAEEEGDTRNDFLLADKPNYPKVGEKADSSRWRNRAGREDGETASARGVEPTPLNFKLLALSLRGFEKSRADNRREEKLVS
ncbi:hypothetical protein MC885_017239 [Smutsia gigantea]|nr:hypothetical protein MC885_017239 [Smutsia gigantea]